jgi:hypothetical protein
MWQCSLKLIFVNPQGPVDARVVGVEHGGEDGLREVVRSHLDGRLRQEIPTNQPEVLRHFPVANELKH